MNNKFKLFTIVELLIVISILAILISLLQPSLSGMFEKSRMVKCSTNLKSQYMAINYHAEDYKVIPCYADNEIAIKQIIQEKLKNYKGLSSYNINLIISKSNLDRIKLNNELNKIIIYFQNKELNSEKLELLLDDKINNDFNLLKDEALMGNKINTNKLLSDTVLESEKNIFYLNLINLRLNKLNEISNLSKTTNLEDAISLIKPPICWKDKANFTQQAKKWDTKKIRKILAKTYNVEIEIKSNSMIEKNILIKKLIIDMCNLANAS